MPDRLCHNCAGAPAGGNTVVDPVTAGAVVAGALGRQKLLSGNQESSWDCPSMQSATTCERSTRPGDRIVGRAAGDLRANARGASPPKTIGRFADSDSTGVASRIDALLRPVTTLYCRTTSQRCCRAAALGAGNPVVTGPKIGLAASRAKGRANKIVDARVMTRW